MIRIPPILFWLWILGAGLSFAVGMIVMLYEPFDLSIDEVLLAFFGCWFLAIVFLCCALWVVIHG